MIKSTNNVNRNTPIIAITAYERTLQLASIFDDTLSKPVTKESITKCMRQVGNLSSLPSSIYNGPIHWPAPNSTPQTISTSTISAKAIPSTQGKVLLPSSLKENNHRILSPDSS
jgi:serine/threonine-protein kinase RIM15